MVISFNSVPGVTLRTQLGESAHPGASQSLLPFWTHKRRICSPPAKIFLRHPWRVVEDAPISVHKKFTFTLETPVDLLAAGLTAGLAVNRADAIPAPVQATISHEGKSTVIELGNSDKIPYVELGSAISLNFKDGRPETISVVEILSNADGSRRYNEPTDRTLDVELSGGNLATFAVTENFADALSSNSEYYQADNSFRWYRIICGEGENAVEYGLWVRTDPPIIFAREPDVDAAPFSYTNDEYGFTVTFTADWADKAVIARIPGIVPAFGISAPSAGEHGVGVVARIAVYPQATWEDSAQAVDERYMWLGSKDGNAFVLLFSSDLPAAANDTETQELFARMQDDLWAGSFDFAVYEAQITESAGVERENFRNDLGRRWRRRLRHPRLPLPQQPTTWPTSPL
ncbi:MAG: hypothetical protein LBF64_02755 [Oscillospiraceae bacterium]|nr:hypothetical protein [Oscillospiraceae bacterium]